MVSYQDIGNKMVAQAAATAGQQWQSISQAATVELRGLAQRLVLIAQACASGEMTESMALRHFQTAKFHVIATIAMLTMIVEASVERIVNGALAVVQDAINKAVGFTLLS